MRRIIILSVALFITASFNFPQNTDMIFYASLNHAIHEGQYDGVIAVGDLAQHGDFGVGSEEKLASELVLLDGKFYGIPSDGKVFALQAFAKIAFASVKKFKADTSFQISTINDIKQLEKYLDKLIEQNGFAAIRINGRFKSIELRSFEKQQKPYKPVDDVKEVKFNFNDIDGTLVGFFTPKSAQVLNSPNYHFHFIDKNRKTGGHALEADIISALVEIDYATELHVLLPGKTTVEHVDLNKPVKPKK